METETPFRQLLVDANQCQKSSEPPCIVEAICAGKGLEEAKKPVALK
jgi:hypothetical protein